MNNPTDLHTDIRPLTDSERRRWAPGLSKGRATPRRPRREPVRSEPDIQPTFEQRAQHAVGHEARRKLTRQAARAAKARVRKANRRRFRDWKFAIWTQGTLEAQIRVLLGESGTPAQQELMRREFVSVAQERGQTVDELARDLRANLASVN